MKVRNYICILFCIIISTRTIVFSQDHVEDAHKHIVKEAWNLLKSSNPNYYNYIDMKNWMNDEGTQGPWYLFNKGRVVAGAYREDEEDPIYNYTCWDVASSTHFWKVELPQNPNQHSPYVLNECTLATCNVPGSAWNKFTQWFIHLQN